MSISMISPAILTVGNITPIGGKPFEYVVDEYQVLLIKVESASPAIHSSLNTDIAGDLMMLDFDDMSEGS